jgi:hypothetical protein
VSFDFLYNFCLKYFHSNKNSSAIECESGNAEVLWNNIKECMLDAIGDLVGKVGKRARKPWVTQEMMRYLEMCSSYWEKVVSKH